jgi:translation elongation factor EF-Tu-like GTPase
MSVTRPVIEAEIMFLSQGEIGRTNPLVLNHPTARYRPHVTLDHAHRPEHVARPERLGVEFPRQGENLETGVPTILRFELLYSGVDYSALKPGVRFRILEGPKLVGTGTVTRVITGE